MAGKVGIMHTVHNNIYGSMQGGGLGSESWQAPEIGRGIQDWR